MLQCRHDRSAEFKRWWLFVCQRSVPSWSIVCKTSKLALSFAPRAPTKPYRATYNTLAQSKAACQVTRVHTCPLVQPIAAGIGQNCGIEDWTIELFSEEVVRGGPAFAVSLVLATVEPALRRHADLGAWQIISPADVVGAQPPLPDHPSSPRYHVAGRLIHLLRCRQEALSARSGVLSRSPSGVSACAAAFLDICRRPLHDIPTQALLSAEP